MIVILKTIFFKFLIYICVLVHNNTWRERKKSPKTILHFLVVTSGVLKGYVQGAVGPNHYLIYRPLCLLGIDACRYIDMLK